MNAAVTFSRPDAETTPTVEVPAGGTYVVEDGDVYEATHELTQYVLCQCADGINHWRGITFVPAKTEDLARAWAAANPARHYLTQHTYVVTGEAR